MHAHGRSANRSQLLVFPRLFFAAASTDAFIEVACDDTSMQSDKVLVLDNLSCLIVWSGAGATDKAQNASREAATAYVKALAAERCPRPLVLSVKESSSMARWLQARLVPGHKDTTAEQRVNNPSALGAMTPAEHKALLAKFFFTNDWSYNQYLHNC